jgi:hypothetical protein
MIAEKYLQLVISGIINISRNNDWTYVYYEQKKTSLLIDAQM